MLLSAFPILSGSARRAPTKLGASKRDRGFGRRTSKPKLGLSKKRQLSLLYAGTRCSAASLEETLFRPGPAWESVRGVGWKNFQPTPSWTTTLRLFWKEKEVRQKKKVLLCCIELCCYYCSYYLRCHAPARPHPLRCGKNKFLSDHASHTQDSTSARPESI